MFRKEFDKMPLQFEADCLTMPKGDTQNEVLLEQEDAAMEQENDLLGKQMTELFDIVQNRVKTFLKQE